MSHKKNPTDDLLNELNGKYAKLHSNYEGLFWLSYMGNHSVDKKMNEARKKRDDFRSDRELAGKIDVVYNKANLKQKNRLDYWKLFFGKYQIPEDILKIKHQVDELESDILNKISKQKEGYIDPASKKFKEASRNKMRTLMRTHDDEKVRKACFVALEELAGKYINEYIALVNLRNKFARKLGYKNFYEYKLDLEEGMPMGELFSLFDEIYKKTKFAYNDVKKLYKKNPKLKYPWNFSYLMTGDFTKEEDPYFQFDDALLRWGRSFAAIGINFGKGQLQLDLLDRKGKYNNGFCHWPELVHYEKGQRIAGNSNFTCNTLFGQIGSGHLGMVTLFHEGGHAAHYLNTEMVDVCLNSEYPPASTAWAETQSQFMDHMFSSIEWSTRYAKNDKGQTYPFELYERKLKKLNLLTPLTMSGILFVANFEKKIYQTKNLTASGVRKIAQWAYKKYNFYDVNSLSALSVPHIYSWESACSYHGYGLADLAVAQWREYFYNKFDYIVDNPRIYKEMQKVWKLGSALDFQDLVKLATGRKLSANPLIRAITRSLSGKLNISKKRIQRLKSVPQYTKKVNLNAKIRMVHGKKLVADNSKDFESMVKKYSKWLQTQRH